MEQKTKTVLSTILLMLFTFAAGFGSSMLINYNTPSIDNQDVGVCITSLENGQEVHSIVVIDTIAWGATDIEILINGEIVATGVSKFEWNNMREPVGEYNITVNLYDNESVLISSDSKIIVIPEEFVVPEDYEFTEDFVVHEGQTVWMNYNFNISDDSLENGWNSVDEKTYYAINNYGTLYINGSILCTDFLGEGNSTTYMKDYVIRTINEHTVWNGVFTSSGQYMRFDDNAQLILDEKSYTVSDQYEGTDISGIQFEDGTVDAIFFDNATYSEL